MRFGKAGTGLSKGRLAAKLRLAQQFARIKGARRLSRENSSSGPADSPRWPGLARRVGDEIALPAQNGGIPVAPARMLLGANCVRRQ
jgi:hypothetical protein